MVSQPPALPGDAEWPATDLGRAAVCEVASELVGGVQIPSVQSDFPDYRHDCGADAMNEISQCATLLSLLLVGSALLSIVVCVWKLYTGDDEGHG